MSTLTGLLFTPTPDPEDDVKARSGLFVKLVNQDTSETVTSTSASVDGTFSVTRPSPGTYYVSTSPDGTTWTAIGTQEVAPANADILHTAGNETAAGVKTFSGDIQFASGRPWTDPTSVGADPTGVADSTSHINVSATTYIKLPPGVFSVSSIVIPSGSVGLKLEGAGPGLTTIKANTASQKVIDVFAHNVEISNLTVNGNGLGGTGVFWEDQAYFPVMHNVVITGFYPSGTGMANGDRNYSGFFDNVATTGNSVGVQWIKRSQYTTFHALKSYNNFSKNVVVGDGTIRMFAIRFESTQLENDSTAGVYNLEINEAEVDFDGYCESDGGSTCADIHVTGTALSKVRAHYYSTGSGTAANSIILDGPAYLKLEGGYTTGFTAGTVKDNSGGASVVITENFSDNGTYIAFRVGAYGSAKIIGSDALVPLVVGSTRATQAQIGDASSTEPANFGPIYAMMNQPSGGSSIGFNAYYNGGWFYGRTGPAALLSFDTTNGYLLQTASSGTQNTAITWTQRQQVNLSGDVIAGRTLRTATGATGSRPSASTVGAGARWYDTTLGQSIVSNGTVWATESGVIYTPSLTPTSVAANTTAEQTFTVTGLVVGQVVHVNGPTPTAGTGIVGSRVSAANTLAINFLNATSGSLTPAAGTYTVRAT